MRKLILASSSPRRAQLIKLLSMSYNIIAPNIDETALINENHIEYVLRISKEKAESIYSDRNDFLVIGADTIVFNGKILGKPKDKFHAYNMIKNLSGKTHSVITGVTILDNLTAKKSIFYVETKVTFDRISKEEINKYVESNEPYDKAGGYAIQGDAFKFIKSINGCYYNVMGFPLYEIYKNLKKFDIS